MSLDSKKIEKILLKQNYVSLEDMEKAEGFAKESNSSAIKFLLSNGIINKNILGQAVAEYLGVFYADIEGREPNREQVLEIPEKIARQYRVILFEDGKDYVTLATDKPKNNKASKSLASYFHGKNIKIAYSFTKDIEKILEYYKKPLDTRFSEIIAEHGKVAPEIIEEIVSDAVSLKASDIHFEPLEKVVIVRFRIDGVLQEAGHIQKKYFENILNKIKIQAKLRIDEHFSTQDGAIRYIINKKPVDVRVSLAPVLDGEKVTFRLLSAYVHDFVLSELGFSTNDTVLISEAAKMPFGMILVTGPTGSGKTTTLYTLIKKIRNPGINITTIENPVEYKIEGINQIQVNHEKDITFANGLRSIVRQDPDVILVGEIRDNETAEIAVNAALTGHLLFSTFHANDAATSIPRLLDMSIEPFLLSSTLKLLIAQRLVRKLCLNCRYSEELSDKNIESMYPGLSKYLKKKEIRIYKSKGCKICNNIGFRGRTGVFEFIKVTKEIQDLILKNPSSGEVWNLAKKQGARSILEDGLEKVLDGTTSLEELMRVVPVE